MPRPLPRCAGCNRTSTAANLRYLADNGAPCCRKCHDDHALFQVCELAHCELRRGPGTLAPCKPLSAVAGGRQPSNAHQGAIASAARACPACFFAHSCTIAPKIEWQHPLRTLPFPATPLAAKQLSARAADMRNEVHLWIMPQRNRCLYHNARVLLWRCFGVIAGLLPGPRGDGHARNRRQALGRHIQALKSANLWPTNDAPVALVGLRGRAPTFAALTPQENARLRCFPDTLSRLYVTDLRWGSINEDPTANANYATRLGTTCAALLRQVGLTQGGQPGYGPCTWDAITEAERAFRFSLHTSTAPIFSFP